MLQYLLGASLVFFYVIGEDEDVVNVDHNLPFCDQLSEYLIHHGLESCWGVAKTKEHHQWFKKPPICPKGGLPFIPLFNPDVVIPPSNIQFGEEF